MTLGTKKFVPLDLRGPSPSFMRNPRSTHILIALYFRSMFSPARDQRHILLFEKPRLARLEGRHLVDKAMPMRMPR